MDISKIPVEYQLETATQFVYGTAGFRDKWTKLPTVMFRMGVLSVLRSKAKRGVIGVMITASHNPEEDNGVKLIDPQGEMLVDSWETYATQIANCRDEELQGALSTIISKESIDVGHRAQVICGYDTRSSSVQLHQALEQGVIFYGGAFHSYGLLTTPQLHFLVYLKNYGGGIDCPTPDYLRNRMVSAFLKLNPSEILFTEGRKYNPVVYVDCANGIGAVELTNIGSILQNQTHSLKVNIVNSGPGNLNHSCGADHVKLLQLPPKIYTDGYKIEQNQRWASLDGDADRLVYFYLDEGNVFRLLDGDKIASLLALHVNDMLVKSKIQASIGVVQTAYANGSSTEFIEKSLGISVACVPTGVKHLHKKAKMFDIGVYFEANGHGTMLINENVRKALDTKLGDKSLDDQHLAAVKQFRTFLDLVNETTGDALSDLLIVEAILAAKNWSIAQWDALYADRPCRQLKVSVSDRNLITTTDAERRCVTPPGLQARIDQLVAKFNKSRAFVRPSGTENIVRVYAEATTAVDADTLATEIAAVVRELVA